MSHPAIKIDGLWKEYLVGSGAPRRDTFYELLTQALTPPWRRTPVAGPSNEKASSRFWALRDVGFQVQPGEVMGVIGRNGAGKSTLLKILSRITPPTRGRIEVRGRLASLLEVGTGFHPELSGRENIFLNGAILGMTRREVLRKFDEIVSFAEIDTFIDTPVKRYSSGMYVRLAFAVAAHLEPDVLVVDEVLAVGDRQFQEKCLGRLDSIAKKEGRTVLFVSHNLDAIARICTEGLYLRSGSVVARSGIREVIEAYVDAAGGPQGDLAAHSERWGTGAARITGFQIRNIAGQAVGALSSGGDFDLVMPYTATGGGDLTGVVASISLADARGGTVLLVSSMFSQEFLRLTGEGEVVCRVKDLNLVAGAYSITLYLGQRGGETFDCLNDVRVIDVIGGDFFGTGHGGFPDQCRTLTRSTWSAV